MLCWGRMRRHAGAGPFTCAPSTVQPTLVHFPQVCPDLQPPSQDPTTQGVASAQSRQPQLLHPGHQQVPMLLDHATMLQTDQNGTQVPHLQLHRQLPALTRDSACRSVMACRMSQDPTLRSSAPARHQPRDSYRCSMEM